MGDAQLRTSKTPVEDTARQVIEWLVEADARQGFARLGVAGGSAATALKQVRLGLPPDVWARLKLTWVDERLVKFESGDSNRGAAHRSDALVKAAPVALELPLVLEGEDAPTAVARVEQSFARDFHDTLDVALLGMGEDGHIASLFPGHALLSATGTVGALNDSPKPPPGRVTLLLSVLARRETRRVMLATGPGKRIALLGLQHDDPKLPACLLPSVLVITDQHFS